MTTTTSTTSVVQAPYANREIWFLTGSQHLYGAEVLDQVHANARQIASALRDSPQVPLSIEVKPVLTDAQGIRRVLLEAQSDDKCAGVIAWMHTFSPAKMWIAGLDLLQKPLLHLHTQANQALPWDEIDMDFMNLNQAAHGDREFAAVQTRLGVVRKTVAGHVQDPHVAQRIGAWMRAAVGRADMATMRLARFGDNMRDVAVTEGDKVEAERRFGVSVNTWPVNELAALVDDATEPEVDDLVEEYADTYLVQTQLRRGGARHESLRYGARIELALRRFLSEGGFTAFTTNFEDLGGLRQLPGLAVQRLMADGYGFGGEGDWKTAMMLRTMKTIAAGLPGGTSFMEDYTYHLVPGEEKILGAHMLEVCPTIAGERPRLEIHPLGIGGRSDPVRLVFDAAPGSAVVLGLADLGERFRFVANTVEVVAPDRPLSRLPVARAVWQPDPNMQTSTESWLMAGGPHHTVLSSALTPEHLTDLAEMTTTELVMITTGTSVREIAQELRWNSAYHRLAASL